MILTKNAMEARPLTSIVDDYRLFTVNKTLLEPPKGDIRHFGVPVTAEAGDIIGPATAALSIGVKNVGASEGAISLRIRDRDGATIWTGSITLAADEYDFVYPKPAYPMPARNLRLRAEAYHDSIVDDYMDKTITLTAAKGSITNYDAPSSAKPGDTVTVSATAKNIGTGSGSFQLRVLDRDTDVDVDKTGWFTLAAGASTTKTLTGTMPDRDWKLTLLLERTLPTGAVAVDDEKKFTAINIVDWWTAIKAWWNSLPWWKKAIIISGSSGGAVAGGLLLTRRR